MQNGISLSQPCGSVFLTERQLGYRWTKEVEAKKSSLPHSMLGMRSPFRRLSDLACYQSAKSILQNMGSFWAQVNIVVRRKDRLTKIR